MTLINDGPYGVKDRIAESINIFKPTPLQDVPRKQLLIFDLKSGWDPLCKFLNKPVPEKPFPHLNKNGVLLKTLADHPVVKQMAKETNIVVAVVASTCVLSLIAYRWMRVYNHNTYFQRMCDTVLRHFGYTRRFEGS